MHYIIFIIPIQPHDSPFERIPSCCRCCGRCCGSPSRSCYWRGGRCTACIGIFSGLGQVGECLVGGWIRKPPDEELRLCRGWRIKALWQNNKQNTTMSSALYMLLSFSFYVVRSNAPSVAAAKPKISSPRAKYGAPLPRRGMRFDGHGAIRKEKTYYARLTSYNP